MHKTTSTDDKRLQNTLKRLGVNTIPGIEEVNIFKENNDVVHFVNPKGASWAGGAGSVQGRRACALAAPPCRHAASNAPAPPRPHAVQASIAANTYVISGPSQVKSKCAHACVRGAPAGTARTRPMPHAAPHAAPRAEIQELLPGILNQMGPDNLQHLKRIMQQVGRHGGTAGACAAAPRAGNTAAACNISAALAPEPRMRTSLPVTHTRCTCRACHDLAPRAPRPQFGAGQAGMGGMPFGAGAGAANDDGEGVAVGWRAARLPTHAALLHRPSEAHNGAAALTPLQMCLSWWTTSSNLPHQCMGRRAFRERRRRRCARRAAVVASQLVSSGMRVRKTTNAVLCNATARAASQPHPLCSSITTKRQLLAGYCSAHACIKRVAFVACAHPALMRPRPLGAAYWLPAASHRRREDGEMLRGRACAGEPPRLPTPAGWPPIIITGSAWL